MLQKMRRKNWLVFLLYLVVSSALTFPIWSQNGIPFRYDWSWPVFDMKEFWLTLFDQAGNSALSALFHNALFFFGLPNLFNIPPNWCLKIFIILIHTAAGYNFYKLTVTRIKSPAVAIVSGALYAFAPYAFIRTIVGFIFSLLAYAVLPFFLSLYLTRNKRLWQNIILGFLLSLIFSQTQAGLLTLLFVIAYAMFSMIISRDYRVQLRNFLLMLLFWGLTVLPWILVILAKSRNTFSYIPSGHEATTLSFMASLPHNLRMMLMTTDHHITYDYFSLLAGSKIVITAYLLFYSVGLFALFSKNNRKLVLAGIFSLLAILPFLTGPVGPFGSFYIWAYNHFMPLVIFRETYHFQFLIAFVAVLLFAIGADTLYSLLNRYFRLNFYASCIKIIILLIALPLIYPYFTFNYAGYLSLQTVPKPYYNLRQFLQNNPSTCRKIFYPPGLGFVSFKKDPLAGRGAANSDPLALALAIPYVEEGVSALDMPRANTYFRNGLVFQFYEKTDDGAFADLLSEGNIDCVIVRTDIITQYYKASNLGREQNPAIKEKWFNEDYLELTRTKKYLIETVSFDDTIYIFKFKPENANRTPLTKPNNRIEQFPEDLEPRPKTYLPLTDWAKDNKYFREGWTRGRYDFWYKLLFTQLRQDFIFTDRTDSVVTGQISERGAYDVWARYLTGGSAGSFRISIDNTSATVTKIAGDERFIWQKIGTVGISDGQVEIINLAGENAIADLVLVKKSS